MAWWSKVGDEVEKHDGRNPQLGAMIRLSFAKATGTAEGDLALYRRDPAKHPDEPNVLPAMLEKARQSEMSRQIRSIMSRKMA